MQDMLTLQLCLHEKISASTERRWGGGGGGGEEVVSLIKRLLTFKGESFIREHFNEVLIEVVLRSHKLIKNRKQSYINCASVGSVTYVSAITTFGRL